MADLNRSSRMNNSSWRPKSWVVPVIVGVLLALYLLTLRWTPAQEEVLTARMTTSDEGSPAELVAKAWVETNEIKHDEVLRFWIAFENRSGEDVRNLHFINFQHPGFEEEGNCWSKYVPLCIDGSKAAGKLPSILKAGQVITVSGDLKPAAYHGRYNLSVVFGWSNPKGGEIRKGLSLGPVEVTTEWREGFMTLFRRLHTLFKDLALPIVAALLTWWVANSYSRSQEHQAQINQIWGTLLGQFLRDTQRYYLPVNGKLNELRQKTRKGKSKNPEEVREHFYYLIIFMRRMKALSEGLGGFSFKNRTGEDVAGLAWGEFRSRVSSRFGAKRLSAALDMVTPRETLAQFNAQLERGGVESQTLLELEKTFKKWVDEDEEKPFMDCLPLLDILYLTIFFELNRPFEPWYGSPPKFPGRRLQAAQKVVSDQAGNQIEELKKELSKYLEDAESLPQDEVV